MQFQPALKGLKNILSDKWHSIQNQPNLREVFKKSPLIAYRKGKSLKDKIMLVKAKLLRLLEHHGHTAGVALVCQTHFRHVFSCTTAALSGLMKSSTLKCCEHKDVSPRTQFFLLLVTITLLLANTKLIHLFTLSVQLNWACLAIERNLLHCYAIFSIFHAPTSRCNASWQHFRRVGRKIATSFQMRWEQD